MDNLKIHIRHIILWEFQLGTNATQTATKICEVFGKDSITDRQCRNWFQKFRAGDLSLKDEPRKGRPSGFNVNELTEVISEKPGLSSRELAEILKTSQSTIVRHLRKTVKKKRLKKKQQCVINVEDKQLIPLSEKNTN